MIGLYHHLIQTLIKRSQVSKQVKIEKMKIESINAMETDEKIEVDQ